MELIKQFSLQHNNSFNIKTVSPILYQLNSLRDLSEIPDLDAECFYILGEGTNSLFVDTIAPVIIKPAFKGISISENDTNYIVNVASGENWHDLVTSCVQKGINGLENLALIPGSVGAAPVQNIGAYGVEFSDFCIQVNWYDFSSKTIKCLNSRDCLFGYRESIFKNEFFNKGIITEVSLSLPKIWQPKLSYLWLTGFRIEPKCF
ncbi:FAD-binding protein [Colwellia sp. MSW7]|uniref:UDP-N-acetylenolpyruvoylglucosamine reductase n=1 Tax=Colwellia maritima TaxID=2912588 RepID=A0ABS9X084_9GAMM|nr:FAD-binding protein [Colwellia maritima]MCI2282881.1 FAD-binding protein [Colwellia maritima]